MKCLVNNTSYFVNLLILFCVIKLNVRSYKIRRLTAQKMKAETSTFNACIGFHGWVLLLGCIEKRAKCETKWRAGPHTYKTLRSDHCQLLSHLRCLYRLCLPHFKDDSSSGWVKRCFVYIQKKRTWWLSVQTSEAEIKGRRTFSHLFKF